MQCRDEEAVVQFNREEDGCVGCGCCEAFGEGSHRICVANPLGAEQGQLVRVEFDPAQSLKSGSIIFIVPVLSLVVGALVGHSFGVNMGHSDPEVLSALFALAALACSVLFMMFCDRSLGKKRFVRPRIVEILSREASGECGG